MGVPVFGAAGTLTTSANTGTSNSPGMPTGIVAGHLLLGVVASKNNATHSWPAPWTKVDQVNSGTGWTVSFAWKIAVGGDTSPSVTWTGSAGNEGLVARWSGTDTGSPIGAKSAGSSGTTSPHSSASITTTRDDSECIYIDAALANTALTTPAGYTSRVSTGVGGSTTEHLDIGDKTVTTNGTATGAISTAGAAAAWVQWQVELVAPLSGPPFGSTVDGLPSPEFEPFRFTVPRKADDGRRPDVNQQFNLNMLIVDFYKSVVTRDHYRAPTWPRDDGRRTDISLQNISPTTLGAPPPVPPNNQDDWPLWRTLPQPDRTQIASLIPELVGLDQFFDGPGRGPVYDYPLPRIADSGRRVDPASTETSFPLYLRSQDQFFGAPGQGPTYDYPNPRVPYYANDLRTWTQDAAPMYPMPEEGIGSQTDWPLPRTAYYANDLRDWRRSAFLGIDKFFGAPGQAPRYDYPNPIVAPQFVRTWLWQTLPTLSPVIASPIASQDWPVPSAAPYTLRASYTSSFPLELLGQDQFFGGAGQGPTYDYPNARIADDRRRVDPIGQGFSTRLYGKDAFFGLGGPSYDWPLPGVAYYAPSLRTWLQDPAPMYPLPDAGIASQTDWPLPRAPYYANDLRDWRHSAFFGVDTFFGLGGPAYDYPNPRIADDRRRSWTYSILPIAVPPAPPPPYAYDYPNPRAAYYPPDLRDWHRSFPLTLLAQDQFFGGAGQGPAYDYPNPRAPYYAPDLRDWRRSFLLTLIGQDKFFGLAGPAYDYPNPRMADDRRRSWSWSILPTAVPPIPPPPYSYDYPNPRAAYYPPDLRDWRKSSFLGLLGKDQFFGAAGQAPAYDWGTPRPLVYTIDLRTWLQNRPPSEEFAPVVKTDWPQPKTVTPLDRTFAAGPSLALQAAAQATPPVRSTENAVPRTAQRGDRTWFQSTTGLIVPPPSTTPPMPLAHWPVPTPPRRAALTWLWTPLPNLAFPPLFVNPRFIVTAPRDTFAVSVRSKFTVKLQKISSEDIELRPWTPDWTSDWGPGFPGGLEPYVVAARPRFIVSAPPPRFSVPWMKTQQDFAPMLAGTIEGEIGTFDFDNRLPTGVTITTVTSITATVHSGTDASPQNIVSGAAQIVNSPASGLAARAVAQTFKAGIGGTSYLLVCLVACSDGVPRSLETHLPFYTPS